MLMRWLADLTAVFHLGFVVFVVLGGLLVYRRPGWAWVHLPAAVWGVAIEWGGWVCPLTPLENWLRRRAGGGEYHGTFVDQYVLPVLYPEHLSRDVQGILGVLVLVVNLVFYSGAWRRYRRLERS